MAEPESIGDILKRVVERLKPVNQSSRLTAESGPPISGVSGGVLPPHDAAERGGWYTVRAGRPQAVRERSK
jgi:hypothetical protein